MSDKELQEYLDFAKALALEAGEIMMKYFRTGIDTQYKEDQTPVTLVDTEINSLVIRRVKEKYPGHGVLGEEESFNLNSDQLWVVDPLDGTPTFASGVPVFAFSLAYVEKGQPKIGVIYDPPAKRLSWALKGEGAYENGRRLDLGGHKPEGKLIVSAWVVGGVNQAVFKSNEVDGKVAAALGKRGGVVIFDMPIAYVLPLVAAGNFDACITSVINPWDLAAGSLIAKEAGAEVTDLFGQKIKRWDKDIDGVLVAAPTVHKELLGTLLPTLEKYK